MDEERLIPSLSDLIDEWFHETNQVMRHWVYIQLIDCRRCGRDLARVGDDLVAIEAENGYDYVYAADPEFFPRLENALSKHICKDLMDIKHGNE